MKKPWNLKYWETGEWQVIEEKLNDAQAAGKVYCPARRNLFKGLEVCNPDTTRVCILGQDPYVSTSLAMGLAFSVPADIKVLPPTLTNIFAEYCSDLHYPHPSKGDLTLWSKRGVLLWNCIPSAQSGKVLSHQHWEEWWPLTEEIINVLDSRDQVVFACLGSVARDFFSRNARKSEAIFTTHPSPRGNLNPSGRHNFIGSRLFTTINAKLNERGLDAIDWRLP